MTRKAVSDKAKKRRTKAQVEPLTLQMARRVGIDVDELLRGKFKTTMSDSSKMRLISSVEVANFLGISTRSVRRLVERKAITYTRIGGIIRFGIDDIVRLIGDERANQAISFFGV